jgi:hypothetical protein
MSDHALGVVGLIVGIVGILIGLLVSYYFYLKSRERIEPRYVLQHEPLLDSSSGAMAEVSLLFREEAITNLNRCLLFIWNSGSRTLLKSAIVDSDQLRVCLPEGSKALGVGVTKNTRQVIGLTASIDESKTVVPVGFDFLDKGDGGVVEILYQGDPGSKPILAGSIIGAPNGLKSESSRLYLDSEDDEKDGTWKGWLVGLAALLLFASGSTVLLGLSHPLTVVLLTLLSEGVLIVIVAETAPLAMQRTLGVPNVWKEPSDIINRAVRSGHQR